MSGNKKSVRIVNRKDLELVPEAASLGAWHRPVPHLDLLKAIQRGARIAGYEVVNEELWLQRNDALLHGIIDLNTLNGQGRPCCPNTARCLLVTTSNDGRSGVRVWVGRRLFPSKAVVFGPFSRMVARRHTHRTDVVTELIDAFERHEGLDRAIDRRLRNATQEAVTDQGAVGWFLDMLEHEVLPATALRELLTLYFRGNDQVAGERGRLFRIIEVSALVTNDMVPRSRFSTLEGLGEYLGIPEAIE